MRTPQLTTTRPTSDAGVCLRVDHVVGPDPRQDLAMRWCDGLDPEVFDSQVHQVDGDQHGGLDGRTHPHHRGTEFLRAELAQGVDVGGVSLHHMGH